MKTLIISDEDYKSIKNLLNDCYTYSDTGNPHDTQIGSCPFCYALEYNEHNQGCRLQALIDIFKE